MYQHKDTKMIDINIKMKMVVKGAKQKKDKDGNEITQLQTYLVNPKSEKLVKPTLKLTKLLERKELEALIGKTIYCDTKTDNLEEFTANYKNYYKANSFKLLKEEFEETFEVLKDIELDKVHKVVDKSDNGKVIIQALIQDDLDITLMDISIKEQPFDEVVKLKGKKVLVTDLKVTTIDMNTYYSSLVIPTIIK